MEVIQPPLDDTKSKKKAKKKKSKVTNNNIAKENDEGEEERLVLMNGRTPDGTDYCKNSDDSTGLTEQVTAIKLTQPKNGLVKKMVNGEHCSDATTTMMTDTTKQSASSALTPTTIPTPITSLEVVEEQSTGAIKKIKKKHKKKKQTTDSGGSVTEDPESGITIVSNSRLSQNCECRHHSQAHDSLHQPAPPIVAEAETSDEPKIVIDYKEYESELQMPDIMQLIQKDLSEPYSIYTYRYFIHNWPNLCFLAYHETKCVGAIVCKLDMHKSMKRGYIAMLAVDKDYRKMKIGTTLVSKAIEAMIWQQADEVVLETEITNQPALRLYENLGFVRDKRLFHYYLNGVDALRLKLWFR